MPSLDVPRIGDPGQSGVAFPIEATLGVEGLPQRGTGQTSLLTGENGAELHGSHFGPWVPVRLRPLVESGNLLSRAVRAGRSAAFANAYPKDWPGTTKHGRRVAGPPLAAKAAGLLTRDHTALGRGEAVSSGIVNDGWRRWLGAGVVPDISPEGAGETLAAIANAHELTLFAHYSTDTAGHRGGMPGGVAALERVDAFLGGLMSALASDRTLLIASDHGNIEDVTGGHTRNPVLGVLSGPAAPWLSSRIVSLVDVTPAVLEWLGVVDDKAHSGILSP